MPGGKHRQGVALGRGHARVGCSPRAGPSRLSPRSPIREGDGSASPRPVPPPRDRPSGRRGRSQASGRETSARLSATLVFPQGQAVAPGPEFQRLEHFLGTWKVEGEQKPNPLGAPAGRVAGTETCSKFTGGFQVVCNLEGTIGGAPYREMATFGYDPEEKAYTWYDIDNNGWDGLAHGTVQGTTWSFLWEDEGRWKAPEFQDAVGRAIAHGYPDQGRVLARRRALGSCDGCGRDEARQEQVAPSRSERTRVGGMLPKKGMEPGKPGPEGAS